MGPKFRKNEEIRVPEVRVVGEEVESKVMSLRDAISLAQELDVDLVEISPKAEPPVCKLIDYKKYVYQVKQKQKEIKSKSVKTVVKEIRFGPNTDEHDYNFKKVHAQNFLKDGFKVKAFVFFKGRTIIFKEKGEILLLRFAQELEELAKVESLPKLEGKRMIMMLSPKAKKK